MIYLGVLAVLVIVMIVIFEKSLQPGEKFRRHNQTLKQRIILSIAFAAMIQFLFITMIPGWLVAAFIIGKGTFSETSLGNEIWGIVMMVINTTFYFFIFYSLLGWIGSRRRRKIGESDFHLVSIREK